MNEKSTPKNPLVLALKKLTYRAASCKEINDYLTKAGFDSAQRKKVLQQLKEWRYLDDRKLAVSLCEEYLQHKHMGYSLIYQKLRQKGIPHDDIMAALEHYDEAQELEAAEYLAEKYLLRAEKNEQPEHICKIKSALARHLQRKGFPRAIILKIINQRFDHN
jgi:regulatory protein